MLLYRANVLDPWHTIPYTQEGTWKKGRFTVDNIQTGEYVIAAIDKSQIGIDETDSPSALVYPNPANGVLMGLPGEYRISNLAGQTLKTGLSQGQIDVSELHSGTYLITINGQTQKIVIQ